jgi:hypothetical protein
MCLVHLSSIFKIISPKTFGPHCVLTDEKWEIFKIHSFKPRYIATSFIAHTNLWTETTSFAIHRFTDQYHSEKTVNILNPRESMKTGGECAHSQNRISKCYLWAVKDAHQCNVGVQLKVPSSITWKLWEHHVCDSRIWVERLKYNGLKIY